MRRLFIPVVIALCGGCSASPPTLTAEETEILHAVLSEALRSAGDDIRVVSPVIAFDSVMNDEDAPDGLNISEYLPTVLPDYDRALWRRLEGKVRRQRREQYNLPSGALAFPALTGDTSGFPGTEALTAAAHALGITPAQRPWRLIRVQSRPAIRDDQAAVYHTVWDIGCPPEDCEWWAVSGYGVVTVLHHDEGWRVVNQVGTWSVN